MEDLLATTHSHSPTGPPPDVLSPHSPAVIISKTKAFVKEYMSHYDASHDYAHILRVLALSQHLLRIEQKSHPSIFYDPTVVTLAALLHDVGDHKYASVSTSYQPGLSEDPTTMVKNILISFGAPLALARYVQTVVKAVSYSHECRNLSRVRGVLLHHPELAIVQDADRLDALGAVGIGRAFTYGGAKGRKEGGMQETIEHFGDKLEKLEGLMKTGEGRRLARARTERLKAFKEWWEEENELVRSIED